MRRLFLTAVIAVGLSLTNSHAGLHVMAADINSVGGEVKPHEPRTVTMNIDPAFNYNVTCTITSDKYATNKIIAGVAVNPGSTTPGVTYTMNDVGTLPNGFKLDRLSNTLIISGFHAPVWGATTTASIVFYNADNDDSYVVNHCVALPTASSNE